MKKTTIDAETFDSALTEVRRNVPAVGLAALSGKTPNRALKNSWTILTEAGVVLERGPISYKWRNLRKANPRLAHSIEEVLAFGDALFNAMSQKQSPESLKSEFIDLKQRFAKIVKETEALAMPKEEKGLFSFFDKGAKNPEEKTELRLTALDQLLEEAHTKSRQLLEKTETDLLAERSFHKAVDWYILALEDAQKTLDAAAEDGSLTMDASELLELRNSLGVAEISTRANMSTSDSFLKIKENLHNKSITFLTAHENTFTVIQGHLRSWKDIKHQTDALNALSDTVKAGSALMSSASSGIESAMQWDPELISKETVSALNKSFGDYDSEISDLVSRLNKDSRSSEAVSSHWEQWAATKQDIIDPVLSAAEVSEKSSIGVSRPTLRKTAKVEDVVVVEEAVSSEPTVVEKKQFLFAQKEWSAVDNLVVNRKLAEYAKRVGIAFDVSTAQSLQWTPTETVARLAAPLSNHEEQLSVSPLAVRSEVDYQVRYGNPFHADWSAILNQKVVLPTSSAWTEEFVSWMGQKDDLDWAYLMQWNDLVYDLLIFEQDAEQKAAVIEGRDQTDRNIQKSLIDRIEEFSSTPGVDAATLKEWGFAGLVTRYAVALDMDNQVLDRLWSLWHNPTQPVDWNEESVHNWSTDYPQDMETSAGQYVVSKLSETPEIVVNNGFRSAVEKRREELLEKRYGDLNLANAYVGLTGNMGSVDGKNSSVLSSHVDVIKALIPEAKKPKKRKSL